MKLNPHFPSDNPMDELLYCFGGDDGGGGGGGGTTDDAYDPGNQQTGQGSGPPGGSDASGDPSEESTVDFSGGFDPGFDEGDTGDTGVSSEVAGSFGGGDSGAGAAGPSLIDSYLDGPMLADISTPMTGGAFVGGVQGGQRQPGGLMQDIPSMDYGSMAGLADVVDPGFDQDSLMGQIAPESAGGERFDYSDQDIFGDLTEEQLQQQEYVSGLQAGLPAAMITSQVQAPPTIISEPEFIQPGGPGTRGLDLSVGEKAKRGVDAAQDYMDALQAANRERIASGGTRDVSTTIDPMDMLDPFGEGFMTDEERAASDAEIAATNARIAALRGASPAEQITAQARQPVDMSPQQGRVVSETVLGEPRTAALGPRDMQIVSDILDQAVPGRVATGARAEPVFGGDLFMDEAVPVSRGTPTSVDVPGYQATDYGREDLAKAEADLAAARAEAYADKQFGFDTGLPGSIDVFGVKVPTGVGVVEGIADALFDPQAALANQIAERGIKSIDGASAEGSANYNPNGLEVVTSGGPLSEGGRTVAYDARGNVVYDSRGIGSQMGDLLTGNRPPENIQALYDRQRAIDEQQRAMSGGDGGQATILPPAQEVVPEPPPEDYRGRDIVSSYQYQPRGPINYAYTGLPSLAPQVLRPSYQARGQYAPLFPMGNLRRS